MHKEIVSYLSEQGYICRYEDEENVITIDICVEARDIQLVMKLPRFYPYEFPEIYCYQEFDFLVPHVYTNKQLCLFDENEETVYPDRYLEIAKISIERAIKLFQDSILKNNLLEYNLEAVSYWNTKAESFVVMLRFDESFSHYIWAYQMTKSSYVCSDSKIELITFIRRLLGLDIDEQDLKQVLFVKSDVVITMLISKLTDVYLWLIGKKNEKLYFDYMSKNNSPSLIISSFNNTVGDCLLGIKIGKLKSNNVRITRKNIAGVLRANSGRRFEKIQICDMRMKRLFTRGGDGRAMFDKKCLFVGGGSVGSYLVKAVTEIGISDDITIIDKDILTSVDVFLDIISAPVIYAILYWWFDKKLWKTEYINKVLQIPDLNGEWTGKAKSSFGDNNEYTMKLTIKQTWSKISFVASFPDTNSKSESNCASFFIETNGDKKIGFGFVNRSREVSAQQYDGYNVLELDSENEIAGRYFNNRDNSAFGIDGGNKGQFKLTRGTNGT